MLLPARTPSAANSHHTHLDKYTKDQKSIDKSQINGGLTPVPLLSLYQFNVTELLPAPEIVAARVF